MPASSSSRATPEPLGWLVLIPLACLVLIQVLFTLYGTMGVANGALVDTDAYMRMVRVQELHANGDWFDATLPRVNPPEGHLQHWTRPLDALLLAGALLLEPVLGFDDALHIVGVLISPIFLALTVLALVWAARPILDVDGRLVASLALLLQVFVMAYTIAGRPDHHSLLLLLFTLAVGLGGRLLMAPCARGPAVAAGAVAALAVWVSPEALVFIAILLVVLGAYWLLGDRRFAAALRNLLGAATACLAVGLLIERGPADLLAVEPDRLSILHLTLFLLLALFWTLVAARPGSGDPPADDEAPPRFPEPASITGTGGRLAVAAIGALVTVALMLVLFPEIRQGPLGPVDPFYERHRLERIVEFQPLIRPGWIAHGMLGEIAHRFLQTFGIGLLAVPYLGLLLRRQSEPGHRIWVLVAAFLVVFTALAFQQQRWGTYAQLVLVLPYAAFVVWLLNQVAARVGETRRVLWRPAVLAIALFWPVVVPQGLASPSVKTARSACPIEELAPTLNRLDGEESRLILAFADYSPALLYLTRHSVLSIPNHRPQPGYSVTYRVLAAADVDDARVEVEAHGVDLILLCPSEAEQPLFARGDRGGRTLYSQLVAGDPPPWLEPLDVPPALRDDVLLFAVHETPLSPHPLTARR